MSNRFEILVEYRQAFNELQTLKQKEVSGTKIINNDNTVTIEPQYGSKMMALKNKCDTLSMILDAMDASED